MTLRGLEIFVAVVKHGKMSAAADELNIAQPTISQAIAELEREYKVILFERVAKRLYITEAGKQLFSYAQRILGLTREMEGVLSDSAVLRRISLGATLTVGKTVLTGIITDFGQLHAGIDISVCVDDTAYIEEMLLNSGLDIGLVEGRVKSRELISVPVISDRLTLICAKNHRFAGLNVINIQELEGQPFIMREEGSGTREMFENELKKYGVRVAMKWVCHASDSIIEAVKCGIGLAVLSKRLCETAIQKGELAAVEIDGIELNRNFSLVYHKTKTITSELESLMDFIKHR